MITKLTLSDVASFKTISDIVIEKKINIIYGLNGTGKSTVSNYFYNIHDPKYSKCKLELSSNDYDFLVYNQSFIQDNFYEAENLNGIFTLSKENKDAESKIAASLKALESIESKIKIQNSNLSNTNDELEKKIDAAKNKVWEIKKNYSGGDRVLEFCLEGYKSDGMKLLNFLEALPKSSERPQNSIDDLKHDIQQITGKNAQKIELINNISLSNLTKEYENVLNKPIIGNNSSIVSGLINNLQNSDWVKKGLDYIPRISNDEVGECPFCQQKTITKDLIESINEYFEGSYEEDINNVKIIFNKYESIIKSLPPRSYFEENAKYDGFRLEFESKYNSLLKVLESNFQLIKQKVDAPSGTIALVDFSANLNELNILIEKINKEIKEHNEKIDKIESTFNSIKNNFWNIIRWEYDIIISSLIDDRIKYKAKIDEIENSLNLLNREKNDENTTIVEEQKKTINIKEAIGNINNTLLDLGINEFKIEHYKENLYKIIRDGNENRVFDTLSEGEKMIISFLYFIEMCRGKKNSTDSNNKKIIVIDDPISSLSHIYVFNIGRLIKNEFLGTKKRNGNEVIFDFKYEQVFILTHSLYFFYELTETNHDLRKESQQLFRLIKNDTGSRFMQMKYEEVQNDYQAYWQIIKDEDQHPALIANCMRNIIEYFFNFVEKKDLNNFFLQPNLSPTRFQAFYRYINRESHSLGQNIFDFKEFNYTDFKDAFKLLFEEAGYKEHYKKMIN